MVDVLTYIVKTCPLICPNIRDRGDTIKLNKLNKKLIKRLALNIVGLVLLACIGFYTVVLSGVFPRIQEIWVTTAMTTMSHKWLATSFIPTDTIDAIMERTRVDDSGHTTDVSLLDFDNMTPNVITLVQEKDREQLDILSSQFVPKEVFIPKIYKPYALKYNPPLDTYVVNEGYTKLEDGLYMKETGGVGWQGYLMLVPDPSRVSLADTQKQHVQGDTVMNMVAQNDAIAGINAGGFVDGPAYNSNGGNPAGLLIVDGEVVSPKNTNDTSIYSVIGLNTDNILVLSKMTTQEAIAANIRDCVNFKPFLVVNGEKMVKHGTGGWGIAPRTAIGQRPSGEILFLCVDGRQAHSIGVDLNVLQDTLYDEGCINAAMVDGGSSTVMVYENEFVNKPSLGHERWINNCWIIK